MKIEQAVQFMSSLPGLSYVTRQAVGLDAPSPINLTVLPEGGNESSPLLYGFMFEEMDRSGDGGIHGNLLRNNGFQGADPGLVGYKGVGSVELHESSTALSDAINSSLSVSVHADATGYVGFANVGYNGVPVRNQTYSCSFWMMGDYHGTLMLRLVETESGRVHASHNMSAWTSSEEFTLHETSFEASASDVRDNEWQLLFDSGKARGHILKFALVQLFPPTWDDRANGLREDIARPVAELKPSFLRFPGGNNLEGLQVDTRWKWNETIGPLYDRPGRDSNWHYPNTDALGLDEYLWWCEDMEMVPVLSVWGGKSYGAILSGSDLHPYLTDIQNELEYLLGPNTSHYGGLRVQNGRNDPWPIQYVEIGNEDDYTGGCDTYPDRLVQIYDSIHSAYPNLTLIASNMKEDCLPVAPIPGLWHDFHYYRTPDDLVAMFDYWDNQPRSAPVIVGEYGCRNTSAEDGVFWSFVQASCSEAVHMIGFERNSDVVRMAAYAPLLQHFGFTQWSPTLIGFDSSPDSLTLSTSYYVQRMFATNRGTTVHPVDSTAGFGPVYWVATSNSTNYQVKLANYGTENQTVNVRVPGDGPGKLESLSGPQNASNQLHNVTITPVVNEVNSSGDGYTVHLDPWGVAVLVV
ncbi:glycoside hydrolase superfamily [Aspergillus aurantiobrunneus]